MAHGEDPVLSRKGNKLLKPKRAKEQEPFQTSKLEGDAEEFILIQIKNGGNVRREFKKSKETTTFIFA